MAKRIATQLAEEIEGAIENDVLSNTVYVGLLDARRWLKWAKQLDARMRLDGSKLNKRRKPKKH